jgi:NAD(P)-dependent dehydrogenase (short-subunit alcohol dehydrogenase family)
MRELAGKTAFVTGGASGIGLALGRAFADAGMKVMLADIEANALSAAVEELRGVCPAVEGVICDVADPDSVEQAAQATYSALGNVHVVCNNAGVAGGSGIDNITLDNWRWVLDVNLMGVLHGIRTFLPHIRAHGEGGHIVNTASMAGLQSGLGFSPYSTSKFAVVNMSDTSQASRHRCNRNMSRLCSCAHQRKRTQSRRAYGQVPTLNPTSAAGVLAAKPAELAQAGLDPSDVAALVLEAIREGELYVFTHYDGS